MLLNFPIYVFDPAKHADQKRAQERQAEEGRNGTVQGRSESGDGFVKANDTSE